MNEAQDFMSWVCDPARTHEELCTVELILEQMRVGTNWPFAHVERGWPAKTARARARKLNPAHRPALHHDELQALQAEAGTMNYFQGGGTQDRPLRDLKALSFFPSLKNVSLDGIDNCDLSPLAALPRVQRLSVAEYGDLYGYHPFCFAQCGEMRELVYLHLALRHPWPDLRGLANWPALAEITFSGNILAFEDVAVLPAARIVALKDWVNAKVPTRDLRRLPLMPAVTQLTVSRTASLSRESSVTPRS